MQKEQLSAFMDGEMTDSALIKSLSTETTLQQDWQRYHLIRDTLRGDLPALIDLDISARVAAAIENDSVAGRTETLIIEAQPKPEQYVRFSLWQKIRPWSSQIAQVGMAACVSLAVIAGVQQYNQPENSNSASDTPVFNTLPIMGQASPVSLGVPGDGYNGSSPQKIQEQRHRVNALMQDYELQRRLYSQQLQFDQQSAQQVTIGVPDNATSGTQQQ